MHKNKKPFQLDPYKRLDKDVWCYGPGDLRFRFDFDDVDQEEVEPLMHSVVDVLNNWWIERDTPVTHVKVFKNKSDLWEASIELQPHIRAEAETPNEAIDAVLAMKDKAQTANIEP